LTVGAGVCHQVYYDVSNLSNLIQMTKDAKIEGIIINNMMSPRYVACNAKTWYGGTSRIFKLHVDYTVKYQGKYVDIRFVPNEKTSTFQLEVVRDRPDKFEPSIPENDPITLDEFEKLVDHEDDLVVEDRMISSFPHNLGSLDLHEFRFKRIVEWLNTPKGSYNSGMQPRFLPLLEFVECYPDHIPGNEPIRCLFCSLFSKNFVTLINIACDKYGYKERYDHSSRVDKNPYSHYPINFRRKLGMFLAKYQSNVSKFHKIISMSIIDGNEDQYNDYVEAKDLIHLSKEEQDTQFTKERLDRFKMSMFGTLDLPPDIEMLFADPLPRLSK